MMEQDTFTGLALPPGCYRKLSHPTGAGRARKRNIHPDPRKINPIRILSLTIWLILTAENLRMSTKKYQ
jgi:hypothetical protein